MDSANNSSDRGGVTKLLEENLDAANAGGSQEELSRELAKLAKLASVGVHG